jgi:hypothetical protein
MDLKVIIDNSSRVICGLNEETTVHDIIVALANSLNQTGRFYLIEKKFKSIVPRSDGKHRMQPARIMAPNEKPGQILQSKSNKNETFEFHLFKSKYLALDADRNVEKHIENELVQKLASLDADQNYYEINDKHFNRTGETAEYSTNYSCFNEYCNTSPAQSNSNTSRSSMSSPIAQYSSSTITSSKFILFL